MTHEDALNMLLSQSCGILGDHHVKENKGWQKYRVELHCRAFIISAKELGDLKYEVDSISYDDENEV